MAEKKKEPPKPGEVFHTFIHDHIEGWGIPLELFLWVLYLGLIAIAVSLTPNFPLFALQWLAGTAPLWIPIGLLFGAWRAWVVYVRTLYISARDPILLEIKIPREIMKSPRAMEVALNTIFTASGETTFIARAWKGQVRAWFSLEIASFGGQVHFYVWTWRNFRNVVESALYAQFPEIEIIEAEDYASHFKFEPERYHAFANNYKLKQKNIPIKSYIDYELDKDPKEEFKIDPLAQVLEFMSQLKPGEQVWLQIVFRATGVTGGPLFPKKTVWVDELKKAVEKIREEASKLPGVESSWRFPNPTWAQVQQMEAIQRHMGKTPFDVGMRGIYIADDTMGAFTPSNLGTTRTIWRPFNNAGYLNEIGPSGWSNEFSYPWQDFKSIRANRVVEHAIDAYRRRSFFYPPWESKYDIMTMETVASLWHFPSSGVTAPGIERIPAKKAEAPSNLPK